MGALDVFTNADKPDSQLDIKPPAFSVTKIGTTFGALLGVVTGGLPAALQADETIRVAAIAAATVVMIGVIALWGVDLVTRQRAAEATLRYGTRSGRNGDAGTAPRRFFATPDVDDLRLQVGPSSDEYKISVAEVDGRQVILHAQHDGEPIRKSFTQPG